MADRLQRPAADLAHTLGDVVGDAVDLRRLLVEQKVIVAEMAAGHMPVKILGLQVKREGVGEDQIERCGDRLDAFGGETRGRGERLLNV